MLSWKPWGLSWSSCGLWGRECRVCNRESFSSFVLPLFMIMDKLDQGFRDRQRKLVWEACSTI